MGGQTSSDLVEESDDFVHIPSPASYRDIVVEELSEDTSSEELSEDTSSEELSEDTSSEELSDDTSSEELSDDTSSEELSEDTSSEELSEDVLTWHPIEGRQSFYTELGDKYFIVSVPLGTDGKYCVFDGVVDISSHPSELYTDVKHILAKIREEDAAVMRGYGWEEIPEGTLGGVHILDTSQCRLYKKMTDVVVL